MHAKTNFDKNAEEWSNQKDFPWNRLKYDLTIRFIRSELGFEPESILSLGCGDGIESAYFDSPNTHQTLVDVSGEMLKIAKMQIEASQNKSSFDYQNIRVEEISKKLKGKYDLILLHNVLEYVANPQSIIRSAKEKLNPKGVLSIRHLNWNSNPYIAALIDKNMDLAFEQIGSREMRSSFGPTISTYSSDEILTMIKSEKLRVADHRGILSICNYGIPNSEKETLEGFEKLKRMEVALSNVDPHRQISRFGLFICRSAQRENFGFTKAG